MLFFRTSLRARPRRPSPAPKARLALEELESRRLPSTMLPGPVMTVSTSATAVDQTASQGAQAVAADSTGDYVITWSSNAQDGNGWNVYAQRYAAGGVPVGQALRVNSTVQDDQTDAAVAMDSAGDFVVTWSSHSAAGGWDVCAQRYSLGGVPQGGEFRVNTTTAGDQQGARVAMDAQGDFVVSWSSNGQDGTGWGVYAQRYSAAGVAQGGEFRVNTTTAGDQKYSSVAMDATGDFVVTWSSSSQDGSGWGVYGQRYSAAGAARGGELRVNTTTAGDQMYSSVAMDAQGDFVVSWSSNSYNGAGWNVYAQRYSAAGAAQGGEFRVNTTTQGNDMYSTVSMDATGDFVVTWSSSSQLGGGWGVYGQRYSAAGVAQGGETQLSAPTAGSQMYSSVVLTGSGQAITAWSGSSTSGTTGIYADLWPALGL